MTALRLPTEGLGYGPARLARLESERAMLRAFPASFMVVCGVLLAVAIGQRFLPSAPIVVEMGWTNPHIEEPFGPVPPVSGGPVLEPGRITPDPGVPMPVPDALAPAPQPVAPGGTTAHDGPIVDRGPSGGGDGPLGPATPEPGVYVYVDQLPECIFRVTPEYSDMARDAGVEGTVRLWALVDLDGSVREVRVIQSVMLLDEAAITAVRKWRFTPALAGGHAVRVWVAVPVKFTLH